MDRMERDRMRAGDSDREAVAQRVTSDLPGTVPPQRAQLAPQPPAPGSAVGAVIGRRGPGRRDR
jgi:hypothetical protein